MRNFVYYLCSVLQTLFARNQRIKTYQTSCVCALERWRAIDANKVRSVHVLKLISNYSLLCYYIKCKRVLHLYV